MKSLIVYYSWSKMGNTEKVAKYLAEKLEAQVEKIVDKNEKKGIIGWLHAGKKATKKETTELESLQANLAEYDLIAIGGPVWSWNITPVIRTFLTVNKLNGKKVILFCTMGGSGDQRSFASMKDLLGEQAQVVGEFSALAKEVIKNEYKAKVDDFLQSITNKV